MTRLVENRQTFIYGLIDPRDNQVRYVGKTCVSIKRRMQAHYRAAKRQNQLPLYRWIRKIYELGLAIDVVTLQVFEPDEDWACGERFWIAYYKQNGNDLLNLTLGGEGLSGHVFSQSHREKIGKAHSKKQEFFCIECGVSFTRVPSEISKGYNKYCSNKCFGLANSKISGRTTPQFHQRSLEVRQANASKRMHCVNGHYLSENNMFINPKGIRCCLECRRASGRKCDAKRRPKGSRRKTA